MPCRGFSANSRTISLPLTSRFRYSAPLCVLCGRMSWPSVRRPTRLLNRRGRRERRGKRRNPLGRPIPGASRALRGINQHALTTAPVNKRVPLSGPAIRAGAPRPPTRSIRVLRTISKLAGAARNRTLRPASHGVIRDRRGARRSAASPSCGNGTSRRRRKGQQGCWPHVIRPLKPLERRL